LGRALGAGDLGFCSNSSAACCFIYLSKKDERGEPQDSYQTNKAETKTAWLDPNGTGGGDRQEQTHKLDKQTYFSKWLNEKIDETKNSGYKNHAMN
jgi:hypothetical protein